MMTRIKTMFKSDEFKTGACIVVFISVLAGLFAPIDFYITNKDYFSFDGMDVVPFACLFTVAFLVAGMIAGSVICLISKKIAFVLEGMMLGISSALYIIGNYMVVDYGAMDGLVVHYEDFKIQGIVQTTTFIVVTLVMTMLTLVRKKDAVHKVFRFISLSITAILVFTLTVSIFIRGISKEPEYISTDKAEFDMSNNENLIVLILDTYDSSIFKGMLDEDYSKYASILEDFVYFPDTLSKYAATDLAFPNMVTGEIYKNEIPYGKYLIKAYNNSPFIEKMKNEGYDWGIYSSCRMPQDETISGAENVIKIRRTVSSHKKLAGYMYKFVGFRYLPQPLKHYCWFYPEDMRSDIESSGDDNITMFNANNYIFYDGIENIKVTKTAKAVKIIHLDGTHAPFSINADFSPSDGTTSIEDEGKGMMVLVDTFLKKLKEEDAYENSAIVILADHGYYGMRGNPLMLVKGVGEKHDFEVSDMPLSYDYLQEGYINLMDKRLAVESFAECATQEERIYLHYSWNKDLSDKAFANTITEYKVTGTADKEENYIKIKAYSAEE